VSAEFNGALPNTDTITFTGVQALCVNCGLPPTVSNTST
jgi:hypothetical protein